METAFQQLKFNFYRISQDENGSFQIQNEDPEDGVFSQALVDIRKYHHSDGEKLVNILFFTVKYLNYHDFISFMLNNLEYRLYPDNEDYNPIPLISICDDAIMVEPEDFPEIYQNLLDPRYRFLDSSIWFRNVSIYKRKTF